VKSPPHFWALNIIELFISLWRCINASGLVFGNVIGELLQGHFGLLKTLLWECANSTNEVDGFIVCYPKEAGILILSTKLLAIVSCKHCGDHTWNLVSCFTIPTYLRMRTPNIYFSLLFRTSSIALICDFFLERMWRLA
jgi:hypothetical protein